MAGRAEARGAGPRANRGSELALGLALAVSGAGLVRYAAARAETLVGPERATALALGLASAPAPVAPLVKADEVANYTLEARLDATKHLVTGTGTLEWTNASNAPANELYFHLYLNAFKNDRTLFLRSPFGAGRSGEHASDWGYIDVTRLAVRELGDKDLWPSAAHQSPDDPDDQTDIRVPLPSPIAPGQKVTIELAWSAKLPSIVERTGYFRGFHMVGQWFPKIARREPDGSWAHFEFHPQAEFYADFGHYSVTLDVPANEVVGATGRLVEQKTEGDRRKDRYEASNVHDFAWTAWSEFRELHERIAGVDVRELYPPDYAEDARASLAALRYALPRYGELYGAYPHPTLTVVHPPEGARNAGGMEYPTLITTGGPWWAAYSGVRMVEGVTIHELGHQWFQGMVASNEPAWPFLDEGLTTFAEVRALDERYGSASLVDFGGLRLSDAALRRAEAIELGHDDPIAQPASAFSSFQSIGGLVYARTATVFETIGNVWGRERLDAALGTYARRYRYRHPEPNQLIDVVREVMGDDPAKALRSALFDKGWVDYAVTDLDCVSAETPAGVFDRTTGRETVDRAPVAREKTYACRALVRRRGTLVFPVNVDLVLDDGSVERQSWDGRDDWTSLAHDGPHKVVAAIVDPELHVTLDDALANNARSSTPVSPKRALERTTYLGELLLAGAGP